MKREVSLGGLVVVVEDFVVATGQWNLEVVDKANKIVEEGSSGTSPRRLAKAPA